MSCLRINFFCKIVYFNERMTVIDIRNLAVLGKNCKQRVFLTRNRTEQSLYNRTNIREETNEYCSPSD